jgi:hypothetical protein
MIFKVYHVFKSEYRIQQTLHARESHSDVHSY